MGFSHKSVRKQEVFASRKNLWHPLSYWWKKAPKRLWEGRRRKSDNDSDDDRDSDRDSEFWELRDLWHLVCLECIVSVLCSVWYGVFSV